MSEQTPQHEVVLREAGPGDALAWCVFVAREQGRTYAGVMPDWFAERALADAVESAGDVASEIAEGRHRRIIASLDEEIVGVAAAGGAPAAWEVELGFLPPPAPQQLDRLYLHPDQHGTGLADRLLAAALRPGPAYLWLISGNERAERFYARHGFTALPEEVLAGDRWANVPMHRMVRG